MIVIAMGYKRETALVVIAVGFAKAIEAVSDIVFGLIQRHERMDYISKSMILKGPLSLSALALGIMLTGSMLAGVIGLAAAYALVLFAYDMPNGARVLKTTMGGVGMRPRWSFQTLGRLTWVALPLGFTTMFVSVSGSIPRYYIERYVGVRELGIFAAIAYLMIAGSMIINAAGQALSPRLARYYAQNDRHAFRMLVLKFMGLAALAGATGIGIAALFGREVLVFLYRPEYAQHVDVLIWVMVAAGISYVGSCLGYAVTATRAFDRFFIPYLAMVVITLAASAFLIPVNGILGAAWTLCLSSLVACAAPLLVFRGLAKEKA
jgi:O-antigen/teichoic acid export membrane protein